MSPADIKHISIADKINQGVKKSYQYQGLISGKTETFQNKTELTVLLYMRTDGIK